MRGHVRKVGHDHLVVGDWLAEGLSLVSVLQGGLVRALGDTEGLGGDTDAAVVKSVHCDGEPVANALDDILNGHFAVVEHKGAGIGGTDAEFVFLLSD